MSPVPPACIGNVLRNLSSSLEKLALWWIDFNPDLNLLDMAAEKVSNLAELRFSTRKPVGDAELKEILNANKRLTSIYIEYLCDYTPLFCSCDFNIWSMGMAMGAVSLILTLRQHPGVKALHVDLQYNGDYYFPRSYRIHACITVIAKSVYG